ncbi:MAG: uroporphyrinogen-III C-methyltransferase [Acidimicrobiales bacterium]
MSDVRVWLVGAGPGDPELLTLRAARLIGEADVVLYDRLVSPEILAMARPGAELIDVGKRPGGSHTQDVLNELLVLHAHSGRRVVRLKGGDPFVFGRGGEEVEVLARAGIVCEVVPGVSSALAGPAAAGIPVTHRQVARAVTIVTGHEMAASDPVDWSAVARLGGTLVVLMGIERRASIVDALVAGGLDDDTAAAVVMHATTPRQRVWTGRVRDLAEADVASPAVMVIGAVATFADEAAALVAARTLPLDG